MRVIAGLCLLIVAAHTSAAQVPKTSRDSAAAKAKADSVAAADSIALVRELERMQGARPDTTSTVTGPQGSTNPRLLPDFSAVGVLRRAGVVNFIGGGARACGQ